MIEFSAHTYVDISWRFGQAFAFGKKPDPNLLQETWTGLLEDVARLDLPVTKEWITTLFAEIAKENPGKVKLLGDGHFVITDASIDYVRMQHYLEAIQRSLTTELKSMVFRAVPKDRTSYCTDGWLSKTQLSTKFPTSALEFQRAGRCYALGEPTACVFHSMRGLEPGLKALAAPFGISASHENWQNIINEIESAVRCLGAQPRAQQKLDDEKFFGNAASHLYFVKNAWRNHVAHTRDSYADGEALKVLERSKDFIESLSLRLSE